MLIFTVFIVWWPWKLGQGHQNLFKSLTIPTYLGFAPPTQVLPRNSLKLLDTMLICLLLHKLLFYLILSGIALGIFCCKGTDWLDLTLTWRLFYLTFWQPDDDFLTLLFDWIGLDWLIYDPLSIKVMSGYYLSVCGTFTRLQTCDFLLQHTLEIFSMFSFVWGKIYKHVLWM